MPKVLVGRYEFQERLGVGGFGVVDSYRDMITDDIVAIKTIPAGCVNAESKRLIREVDILCFLYCAHPHVVDYLSMFVTHNYHCTGRAAGVQEDDYSFMQDAKDVPAELDVAGQNYRGLGINDKLMRHYEQMRLLTSTIHSTDQFNLHVVMPLMKGDLLAFISFCSPNSRERIRQNLSLEYLAQVSVVFAFQITFGLDFLHKSHILHRDIKPDNILIRLDVSDAYQSTALITDLGLARDEQDSDTFYICTRYYRPPEMITNSSKGSPAVDIWSLGCVFYEMCTGHILFSLKSALREGVWDGLKASSQLEEVLNVIGTPSLEDVQRYVPAGNVRQYLERSQPRESQLRQLLTQHWHLVVAAEERDLWMDLIEQCLAFFPAQRPSAEQLCRHPLFRRYKIFYNENVMQYRYHQYIPTYADASLSNGLLRENKATILEIVHHALMQTMPVRRARRTNRSRRTNEEGIDEDDDDDEDDDSDYDEDDEDDEDDDENDDDENEDEGGDDDGGEDEDAVSDEESGSGTTSVSSGDDNEEGEVISVGRLHASKEQLGDRCRSAVSLIPHSPAGTGAGRPYKGHPSSYELPKLDETSGNLMQTRSFEVAPGETRTGRHGHHNNNHNHHTTNGTHHYHDNNDGASLAGASMTFSTSAVIQQQAERRRADAMRATQAAPLQSSPTYGSAALESTRASATLLPSGMMGGRQYSVFAGTSEWDVQGGGGGGGGGGVRLSGSTEHYYGTASSAAGRNHTTTNNNNNNNNNTSTAQRGSANGTPRLSSPGPDLGKMSMPVSSASGTTMVSTLGPDMVGRQDPYGSSSYAQPFQSFVQAQTHQGPLPSTTTTQPHLPPLARYNSMPPDINGTQINIQPPATMTYTSDITNTTASYPTVANYHDHTRLPSNLYGLGASTAGTSRVGESFYNAGNGGMGQELQPQLTTASPQLALDYYDGLMYTNDTRGNGAADTLGNATSHTNHNGGGSSPLASMYATNGVAEAASAGGGGDRPIAAGPFPAIHDETLRWQYMPYASSREGVQQATTAILTELGSCHRDAVRSQELRELLKYFTSIQY